MPFGGALAIPPTRGSCVLFAERPGAIPAWSLAPSDDLPGRPAARASALKAILYAAFTSALTSLSQLSLVHRNLSCDILDSLSLRPQALHVILVTLGSTIITVTPAFSHASPIWRWKVPGLEYDISLFRPVLAELPLPLAPAVMFTRPKSSMATVPTPSAILLEACLSQLVWQLAIFSLFFLIFL